VSAFGKSIEADLRMKSFHLLLSLEQFLYSSSLMKLLSSNRTHFVKDFAEISSKTCSVVVRVLHGEVAILKIIQ